MTDDSTSTDDLDDRHTDRPTFAGGRRGFLAAVGGGTVAALTLGTAPGGEAPSATSPENHTDTPALDYVSPDDATHRAVQSGRWTDPATWDDGVPGDGARALIGSGVDVTLDHEDEARLQWVRVDGSLEFATDTDTYLGTETLVTAPDSRLTIGTAENPVAAAVTATVEFVDRGPIDEAEDPERVSKGLLPHSTVRMRGASKTGFLAVDTPPRSGDSSLELVDTPDGWSRGDTVILAGVSPDENQDEEVTVASVDGTTVTVEESLQYDHVPPKDDLSTYVMNVDRNVRFRSENDAIRRRGHVMFMGRDVDIENVGFYDVGRTDKRRPFTNPPNGTPPETDEPNPLARYGCHFHRLGVDTEGDPARVAGCVIWGSPGWGFVNHRSDVHFDDNVSYEVLGAGFVAEAGMEVGRFHGNFALRSAGSGDHPDQRMLARNEPGKTDDFGHAGHGFWFQSPTVSAEGNIAAGHRSNAFSFWTRAILDHPVDGFPTPFKTETVPVENLEGQPGLKADLLQENGEAAKIRSTKVRFRPFRNNTAFASGGGISIDRNHRISEHYRYQEWSVIEGFTAYNIGTFEPDDRVYLPHQGGSAIIQRFARNLIVRDSYLVGRNEGQWAHRGAGNQGYTTMLSVENTTYEDWGVGIDVPHRDKGQVVGCHFDNEVDISIFGGDVAEGNSTSSQDVEIRDCTFATDQATVRMQVTPDGDGDPELGDDDGAPEIGLGRADNLYDLFSGRTRTLNGRELYFDEQAPGYVPLPDQERVEELGTKHGTISDLGADYRREIDVDGVTASDLVGMTNRELMLEHGIAVEGDVMPEDAVDDSRVVGGTVADRAYDETWVDASETSTTGVLSLESDPAAARNLSLVAPDRPERNDPPTEPDASYEFEVGGEGEYAIWARLFGAADLDGKWAKTGFWMRLDGGDWIEMDDDKGATGSYEWHDVATVDEEWSQRYPMTTYDLSDGTHTLDVAFADRGARLDGFYVTNNLLTVPVGPSDAGSGSPGQ